MFKCIRAAVLISALISVIGCKTPAETRPKQPAAQTSTTQLVPAQTRQLTADRKELEAMAKDYINLLAKGDFETAGLKFTGATKENNPAKSLQELWFSLIAKNGPFVKQASVQSDSRKKNIIIVTCKFEKDLVDVKIVYNEKGEVTSVSFPPRKQPGTD
jgi:hypothetical protein